MTSTDSLKRRETPDEWAARMVREHGPVPMRIGRRVAHLTAQTEARKATEAGAQKGGDAPDD